MSQDIESYKSIIKLRKILSLGDSIRSQKVTEEDAELLESIFERQDNWPVFNRFVGEMGLPFWIIDFATRFIKGYNRQFESVLDPWAQSGSLLSILTESGLIKKAYGSIINETTYKIANYIAPNDKVSFNLTEPLSYLAKANHTYDLVISNLPWNHSSKGIAKIKELDGISDTLDNLILLLSCQKLRENGIGLFFVPYSFIYRSNKTNVYNNLDKYNLSLNAYLEIPSGSFAPITNIGGALIVVSKVKSEKIYAGIIKRETDLQNRLIENYFNNINDVDVSLGVLVDPNDFKGIQPIILREKVYERQKSINGENVFLGKAVVHSVLVRNGEEHKDRGNSVFLPLIGKQNAVNTVKELIIKHHNYIQMIVDPEIINPNYLASYFNTDLGMIIRKSAESGFIPKLNKRSILDLEIILPLISIQNEIIEIERQLKYIALDIQDLHDRLWIKHDDIRQVKKQIERYSEEESFEEWINSLPFPLASILRQYHVKKGDYKIKYEHLLHFFESTSELLATIILSGIWYEDLESKEIDLPQLLNKLRGKRITLATPTFSTWNQILSHFSKKYRTLLHSRDEEGGRNRVFQSFKCESFDILEIITSKRLFGVLDTVNTYRNEWLGHDGITSTATAKNRLRTLEDQLLELRNIFKSIWREYQLIMPINTVFKEGVYQYKAKLIHGSALPFEEIRIESSQALEDKTLHMKCKSEKEVLKLLPFFKMGSPPNTSQEACYFYNRIKSEGLRFISYHYEEKAEIYETSSTTMELIKEIVNLN